MFFERPNKEIKVDAFFFFFFSFCRFGIGMALVFRKSFFLLFGLLFVVLPVQMEEINVAAWNIQIFGTSKMSDNNVVDVLVDVLQRYDLTLIQEIRDASNTALWELLDDINQGEDEEDQYTVELSERLGRSSSKEQYAYLYKESKFKSRGCYVYADTADNYERPPYVCTFEIICTGQKINFIGLHSKPTDAGNEIGNLTNVYADSVDKTDIESAIFLGDFNAGCTYVTSWTGNAFYNDDRFVWLIGDDVDTTVGNSDCPYDRIVKTKDLDVSTAFVYNFQSDMGLTQDFAEEVSDHYPVYYNEVLTCDDGDDDGDDDDSDTSSSSLLAPSFFLCSILFFFPSLF